MCYVNQRVYIMKLKDFKNSHFACIYCLEFPNGMKYVGKTHDLSDRVSLYERFGGSNMVNSAIKEFGIDNIELRVLCKLVGLCRVDMELCLSILEIKYIRELGTIYPNGLNVSFGGELLGIPIEHLTTDENAIKSLLSGNKILLEYDTGGNFVKEYASIARFAYEKGYIEDNVRVAVDKMRAYKGKHILRTKRYDYIPEKIDVGDIKVVERVKVKTIVEERVVVKERDVTKCKTPVVVYNVNGDFVGEYESNGAACRALYISGSNMPLGVYKNGYIAFKKISNDYPRKIENSEVLRYKVTREDYRTAEELEDKPILVERPRSGHHNKHEKLRHSFPINQFMLNGDFVAQYKSIRDASDVSGIPYSQIYNCVMGKTNRAKGYFWRCANDEKAENVVNDIKKRKKVVERVAISNNLF